MTKESVKTECNEKKKSKLYGLKPTVRDLVSIGFVVASVTTFTLTTFATNSDLSMVKNDAKESLRVAKAEIQKQIEKRDKTTNKLFGEIKGLLKTMDKRLWEMQKQKTN